MKLAFIGLGIMGSRMAANLQRSGHELTVYNRTRKKADELLQGGAVWAASPMDAARDMPLVITMLTNPQVVHKTALSADGFLQAMQPGSLWVDCSTVNPSFTREMADAARRRQVRFLDAPVAGSRIPAEKAQLTFLVGGEEADLQEIRPLLEVMGQKTIHAGGIGMGSSLKLVFNLLLGLSMLSFAEALVLGESLGIAQTDIFEALQGAIVVAPSAMGKRQKIESGDYSPDFPLRLTHKDLEMISISGFEVGASLPLSNVAKEIYALAMRYGLGDQDLSAIYRFISEKKDGSQ
jgi:3-hydroxyisobutyrate dehydrogenase-like beta-hydroxyacid dehydrogenase